MKNKFVPFSDIPKHKEFRYQGRLFLKTSDTTGVSQDESVKHRTYLEFDPDCPVEKNE